MHVINSEGYGILVSRAFLIAGIPSREGWCFCAPRQGWTSNCGRIQWVGSIFGFCNQSTNWAPSFLLEQCNVYCIFYIVWFLLFSRVKFRVTFFGLNFCEFCLQVCLHMFTVDFLNQVANGLEKDSMSVIDFPLSHSFLIPFSLLLLHSHSFPYSVLLSAYSCYMMHLSVPSISSSVNLYTKIACEVSDVSYAWYEWQ